MFSLSMRWALVPSTTRPSKRKVPDLSRAKVMGAEEPLMPVAALGTCTGTFLEFCTTAVTMKMMRSTSMISTSGTMLMATIPPPLRVPPTSPAIHALPLGLHLGGVVLLRARALRMVFSARHRVQTGRQYQVAQLAGLVHDHADAM